MEIDSDVLEPRNALAIYPLTYASSWPTALDAYRVFDWRSGNGTTPTIGPALSAGGTPAAGYPTPWQTVAGVAQTSTLFDSTEYYRQTATSLDPAAGQDVVIAMVLASINPATSRTMCGTRTSKGWCFSQGALNIVSLLVTGDSSETVTGAASNSGAWIFVVGRIDRDGTVSCFVNGTQGTPAACPAGALGVGAGIGLMSEPDGSWPGFGYVHRLVVYNGAGIADVCTPAYVASWTRCVFGYAAASGAAASFSRGSALSALCGSNWQIASINVPISGTASGYRRSEARGNKCYNVGPNPTVTNGWTASGGMALAIVAGTDMLANGVAGYGPRVLEITNASGNVQYLTTGDLTGGVAAHSLSVFANQTAGAGTARMGLYDGSTFTQASAAISSGWVRTEAPNITPANANQQWCLEIADGDTWEIAMAQLEVGATVSDPIPNQSTAGDANRSADALTCSHGTIGSVGWNTEVRFNRRG